VWEHPSVVAKGSFDLAALGRPAGKSRYIVTAEAIRAYAEATDETSPAARRGESAPPVFACVPLAEALEAAAASVVSEEARRHVVHYEHDIVLHRPLEPGTSLISAAKPEALLPRPTGTALVLRGESRLESGELVAEHHETDFYRGVVAAAGRGERAPSHRLEVHGPPLAEIAYPIADDLTDRYAAASGDDFAIHLDDAFARSVGLPGRIVHGLCTMALAGRAVLDAAGVDEPRALRRLAVRFSAPLFPGDTLTTRVWRLRTDVYGFDAVRTDGTTVATDGLAELTRSDSPSGRRRRAGAARH
jgi:acyl dehydratase